MPLRFVLVRLGEVKMILDCTDRALSPEEIIRLYGYRFKIETTTFRAFKQEIAGFFYHFWSAAMPRLNRFARHGTENPLRMIRDEKQCRLIIQTLKAIEGYVMLHLVVLRLLQIGFMRFSMGMNPGDIRWLRTVFNTYVSEATLHVNLRQSFSLLWLQRPNLAIMQIIRKHVHAESADSWRDFVA